MRATNGALGIRIRQKELQLGIKRWVRNGCQVEKGRPYREESANTNTEA